MPSSRCPALAPLLCAIAVGCSGEPGSDAAPPPPSAEVSPTPFPLPSSDELRAAGRDAYERVCARCHEMGLDGAPVTGNADDWQERSKLWQAVLVEHVKQGYLEMPARGGDPELSDVQLNAAAEYMLGITHPELPGD